MKITFTPSINQHLIKKQSYKNNSALYKDLKELPKNSMSDFLGRTQLLSFKGINTSDGDYVEHTCTEKKGIFGFIKEHIVFNKTNGNYSHTISDEDDNVLNRDEYFPLKGIQVSTTYDKNGIATIKTTSKDSTTIEKLDTENRQIYFEHTTKNTKRIEETDYERGRKVINVVNDGLKQPTIVIDLMTGKSVSNGELVVDTIYDEQSGEYTIKNIVTNRVYKKEKFDELGDLVYSIEYNPKTGLILKDKRCYSGEYIEDTYTGENPNRLVSSLFVSADGREKEVVIYDEDGETISNHVRYLYKPAGIIDTEIKFNGVDAVSEKILYKHGIKSEVFAYDEKSKKLKFHRKYNKKGGMIYEKAYQPDGKTLKAERSISRKGEITIVAYNEFGQKVQIKEFDSSRKVKSIELFDTETNSVKKGIYFNNTNGEKKIIEYDTEYGDPINETIVDKKGRVLVKTIFQDDGRTPIFEREYNEDGSYIDTTFDEFGEEIESIEYNKDGTKKN